MFSDVQETFPEIRLPRIDWDPQTDFEHSFTFRERLLPLLLLGSPPSDLSAEPQWGTSVDTLHFVHGRDLDRDLCLGLDPYRDPEQLPAS